MRRVWRHAYRDPAPAPARAPDPSAAPERAPTPGPPRRPREPDVEDGYAGDPARSAEVGAGARRRGPVPSDEPAARRRFVVDDEAPAGRRHKADDEEPRPEPRRPAVNDGPPVGRRWRADDDPALTRRAIVEDGPPVEGHSPVDDEPPPTTRRSLVGDDEPPPRRRAIVNDEARPIPRRAFADDEELPIRRRVAGDGESPLSRRAIVDDHDPPVRRRTVAADNEAPFAPWSIERVGECLLAAPNGKRGSRTAAVAQWLPPEPDRLSVVVGGQLTDALPELARQLPSWFSSDWDSVRLVVDRAGLSVSGGDVPPAQILADRLGREVLAPDGALIAVPGGSLFVVVGDHSVRHGAWWVFRPGRQPVSAGPRFPEPEWASDLAGFTDPGDPEVTIDHVPAGLWIRRRGAVPPTDLAFAVPVDTWVPALLVSRPGDEPLPANRLARLVATLPAPVKERLVAMPYGDRPLADAPVGEVLAATLNRPVRVRTGISLQVDPRKLRVVAVDRRGKPAWRPFVHELAWRPDGSAPVATTWKRPIRGLVPIGPAEFELNRQWSVELIEAGLWIKSLDPPDAGLVRGLPFDPEHCTVIIGAPGVDAVRPPWRAIMGLLRRLPADARKRVRLALPYDAGERIALAAARTFAHELAGRPVHVVSPDANVAPRYLAVPLRSWLRLVRWPGPVMRLVEHPSERRVSRRWTEPVRRPRRPAPARNAAPVSRAPDRLRSIPRYDDDPVRAAPTLPAAVTGARLERSREAARDFTGDFEETEAPATRGKDSRKQDYPEQVFPDREASEQESRTPADEGVFEDEPVVWRARHYRDDAAAKGDDVRAATANTVIPGQLMREAAEE